MAMRCVWIVTALTALTALARPASGQDAPPLDPGADRLADLNALIRVPSAVTDITEPLMDALAGMRSPQRALGFFMTDETRGWSTASSWASSEASKSAIDTAIEITSGDGPKAIGLLYGTEGIKRSWIDAGLANEAGENGLIHAMEFGYLDGLEDLMLAMSIDAWAASEVDNHERVRDVLLAWVRLARIVADREMADEKFFAYEMARRGLQRFRDIVYTHDGLFDVRGFKEINEALDNATLKLDAVRLPRGDRFEAMQLIERTMEPEGEVDPTKFGLVMASGATGDRPLELFARTAEMNASGAVHAGWFSTYDELNKVLGDWTARWNTPDFHDTSLDRPSDYATLNTTRYALIEQTVGEISDLFDERMNSLTELFGTRSAFGVAAFEDRSNRFPPSLRSVSPQFVDKLDVDPWSIMFRFRRGTEANISKNRYEKSDVFRYLVPIRDQRWGPREEKVPYQITVTTSEPAAEGSDEDGASFEISEAEWEAWEANQRKSLEMLDTLGSTVKQMVEQFQATYQMVAQMEAELGTEEFERVISEESMGNASMTEDYSELDLRMIGYEEVNEQNAGAVAIKTMRFSFSPDGLGPAIDRVASMDDPSVDDYVNALRSRIETMAQSGALPYGQEDSGGPVGASFTVAFDDSVFLLYSVWEDHEDDGARVVGPEGTDYLIWPPVPTLVREAGSP